MIDNPNDPKDRSTPELADDRGDPPPSASWFSPSPRLTYLLIGGAALGVIVLMCLVVGLLIALQ